MVAATHTKGCRGANEAATRESVPPPMATYHDKSHTERLGRAHPERRTRKHSAAAKAVAPSETNVYGGWRWLWGWKRQSELSIASTVCRYLIYPTSSDVIESGLRVLCNSTPTPSGSRGYSHEQGRISRDQNSSASEGAVTPIPTSQRCSTRLSFSGWCVVPLPPTSPRRNRHAYPLPPVARDRSATLAVAVLATRAVVVVAAVTPQPVPAPSFVPRKRAEDP